INIAPLQTVLNTTQRPVYGDDQRSVDREKVFSVAPIRLNGELQGYLYIILQGEELNALAETAWQQTFWNTVMWTLLLVAIFGVLTGLLL
ncbi:two-component sensor histidine kinase, partial [Enterobacter hormaechei]|nr:two-component sensor histidine kinase [Enterobacter hormaechei]